MPFPIIALIGGAPQIIKAVGSLFSKKGRKEINPKVKTGASNSLNSFLSSIKKRPRLYW